MSTTDAPTNKIDRQTTTPFLLKLFYRLNSFHRVEEFSTQSGPYGTPRSYVEIYTWPSCTLSELSHLLTTALPNLIPDPKVDTRLSFRLIFPDTRQRDPSAPGRWVSKDLGTVVLGSREKEAKAEDGDGEDADMEGGEGAKVEDDSEKTLQDARFVIGDYVSCAIFPPLSSGAPQPAAAGRGASDRGFGGGRGGVLGGPRENGFGGFRVRGSGAGRGGNMGMGVPSGEWRRGERVPEGPRGGGGFGRREGRGRGW